MKIIRYSSIAILLIGLGWAYYSYASYLPVYSRSVAESVLVDETEQFIVRPTRMDVLQPLNLAEHKWQSVQLNVRTFSEFKYTESRTLALPGRFFLLSNPDERDNEIHKFEQNVDTVINAVNGQNKGYPKSNIYAPFIEEVNRISAIKADVKAVTAYTDCCDNTSVFSIYRDSDRNLIKKHPEKVKELLSQYGKPGNLHGLTIWISFKPKTDRDNEYFTLMSVFYKKLFEEAGAEVHVGANIVFDNTKS